MGLLDFIAPGAKKKTQNAKQGTQNYLRFGEIRDNTLVLKNGGLRAVLKVSSINFNLKSEQEQNAIIKGYQNFLNSLEFPVQIVVRSKKLNIDNYIRQIKKLGDKQENRLLQEQTYEYAEFINRLVEYADIMEKEFYVILPYDPARVLSSTFIQSFFQRLSPKDSYGDIKRRRQEFNNLKKGLIQRVHIVKAGLEQCGLKAEQLSTLELIELFYNIYNPGISRTAKAKNLAETSLDTTPQKAN